MDGKRVNQALDPLRANTAYQAVKWVPPVKAIWQGRQRGEAEFRHGLGVLSRFGEATLALRFEESGLHAGRR